MIEKDQAVSVLTKIATAQTVSFIVSRFTFLAGAWLNPILSLIVGWILGYAVEALVISGAGAYIDWDRFRKSDIYQKVAGDLKEKIKETLAAGGTLDDEAIKKVEADFDEKFRAAISLRRT